MENRKYRNVLHPEVEILKEVALHGKSQGWGGSLEELDTIKKKLAEFNVFYVCDFTGTWKKILT
jgi:hypothetical protein